MLFIYSLLDICKNHAISDNSCWGGFKYHLERPMLREVTNLIVLRSSIKVSLYVIHEIWWNGIHLSVRFFYFNTSPGLINQTIFRLSEKRAFKIFFTRPYNENWYIKMPYSFFVTWKSPKLVLVLGFSLFSWIVSKAGDTLKHSISSVSIHLLHHR